MNQGGEEGSFSWEFEFDFTKCEGLCDFGFGIRKLVIIATRVAERSTVTSFPRSAVTIRTRLVYVQLDSAVGIYEEEERL